MDPSINRKTINRWIYEFAVRIPLTKIHFDHCFQLEFLKVLVFAEGGKLDKPEKNNWNEAFTNNKRNPQIAPS